MLGVVEPGGGAIRCGWPSNTLEELGRRFLANHLLLALCLVLTNACSPAALAFLLGLEIFGQGPVRALGALGAGALLAASAAGARRMEPTVERDTPAARATAR